MTAPEPPAPHGYLATWVGGLLGVLVLGGIGVGSGLGLMELYEDPDAGMANLALLLFPLALGTLGVLVGMFAGIRTALRWRGDPRATRTALVAAGLTVLVVLLVGVTSGLGLPLLLATPVAARWLVLQDGT